VIWPTNIPWVPICIPVFIQRAGAANFVQEKKLLGLLALHQTWLSSILLPAVAIPSWWKSEIYEYVASLTLIPIFTLFLIFKRPGQHLWNWLGQTQHQSVLCSPEPIATRGFVSPLKQALELPLSPTPILPQDLLLNWDRLRSRHVDPHPVKAPRPHPPAGRVQHRHEALHPRHSLARWGSVPTPFNP
jgi:hypothetical protein